MSKLKAALDAAKITVRKYDPDKTRPVITSTKPFTIDKFVDEMVAALGSDIIHHPEVAASIRNKSIMVTLLEEYAEAEGVGSSSGQVVIPQELSHLTLNVDMSSREQGAKRFFCTTQEEIVDPNTSGAFFIDSCGMSPSQAVSMSRPVVPKYMPRKGPGIHPEFSDSTNATVNYFNTYIPPRWERWRRRNPKAWAKLPAKPPTDIIFLIKHVLPHKVDREYFYAWVYTSIVGRAFVYPNLCGKPGIGKNRIHLLLKALHGENNVADGKKETLGANQSKFNAQLADKTLLVFDELEVTKDMESRMKQYQNATAPIEGKGVDTITKEIYTSMIISNNYLRDNYLPFDARKFAPLEMGRVPLKEVMTEAEIGVLSDKLGEIPDKMDVRYVAQIAKWILHVGPKYTSKFRNLEYKGPMFWKIAHASMSHWQKELISYLTTQTSRGPIVGWDEEKQAFLWSKAEEALKRKRNMGANNVHFATIQPFLENYCDRKGRKVFEVEEAIDGVMEDFWVRPIGGLERIRRKEEESDSDSNKSGGPKLVRPPGLSQFQWRKMKAEWEASQGKGLSDVIAEENEKDLV